MKKFLVITLLITSFALPQSKDADIIIKNLKTAFKEVNNYAVNVTIKTDISFLKVPPMKAKVYFKQPDKVHFESEGFALLPRNGMYTSPLSFLNGNYTAIYVRDEDFEGHKTSVVKTIPLDDKGDLILTTLWIDQANNVIRKVEASTKINGTFTLILNYDDKGMKYPLPSSMVFSFNAPQKNMRHGMNPEFGDNASNKSSDMISGKIYINYSNYVVNKGIPDNVFEKDNNNKAR